MKKVYLEQVERIKVDSLKIPAGLPVCNKRKKTQNFPSNKRGPRGVNCWIRVLGDIITIFNTYGVADEVGRLFCYKH